MALGFGWRSDNRRSSLTFRGIVEVAGAEGLGRVAGKVKREKSPEVMARGQVVVERQAGTRSTTGQVRSNQVSNFVIAPDDHLSGFD